MKEVDRQARNKQRLSEMYPPMATVVRRVIDRLEKQGFRPRIQGAWRSKADQIEAFNAGRSKVKFGYHNVTGAKGAKESLACDLLDDDKPLNSRRSYLIALAIAARAEGLETGILWGLTSSLKAGVEGAISEKDINRKVKIGWDPTHIQPHGFSIALAKAGQRPSFKAAKPKPKVKAKLHVVRPGETLGEIAKAFKLTLARLLDLNPKKRPNPNLLLVGEKIRVA
jgi:LysM repeat protein